MKKSSARILLALALLVPQAHADAACRLRNLAPQQGQIAVTGIGPVSLGESDDPAHARAWQGPVVAGKCSIDLGIIELPIVEDRQGAVYFTTYSGSMRQIARIDFSSCAITWKSQNLVGPVTLTAHGLRAGGQRIDVDAKCQPIGRQAAQRDR